MGTRQDPHLPAFPSPLSSGPLKLTIRLEHTFNSTLSSSFLALSVSLPGAPHPSQVDKNSH